MLLLMKPFCCDRVTMPWQIRWILKSTLVSFHTTTFASEDPVVEWQEKRMLTALIATQDELATLAEKKHQQGFAPQKASLEVKKYERTSPGYQQLQTYSKIAFSRN